MSWMVKNSEGSVKYRTDKNAVGNNVGGKSKWLERTRPTPIYTPKIKYGHARLITQPSNQGCGALVPAAGAIRRPSRFSSIFHSRTQ